LPIILTTLFEREDFSCILRTVENGNPAVAEYDGATIPFRLRADKISFVTCAGFHARECQTGRGRNGKLRRRSIAMNGGYVVRARNAGAMALAVSRTNPGGDFDVS